MSRPIDNEDIPSPADLIHECETAVSYLVCTECHDKGMTLDDDGLHWTCPKCGHQHPTIKQLIADTRVTLEHGRQEFLAGDGQRQHL